MKLKIFFFANNKSFKYPTIPILWKEINLPQIYKTVKDFSPDITFVYGSYIIKEPLISILKNGKVINMHLGVSPYYRGSGTNFWPFVNNELEYVGATLLHLDSGIDTGDIIAHVFPKIESNDNVHTLGCKTIIKGVEGLIRLMDIIRNGEQLPSHKQWKVQDAKYYETKDITEEVMKKYYENLEKGIVNNFLSQKKGGGILHYPLP